jgi:superfamily II DNA/RNA helicase
MSDKKYSLPVILNNLRIEGLNEMQEASIAANKERDNIILLSATGSGKTLAFLLPVLDGLDAASIKTSAMIVTPSRELALQIEQVFKTMGTGFKVTCCYGGHKREIEENNLVQPPALIVGTPGRIADHIRRGNITVDTIHTLVLDEFDKTLEAGFHDEVSFVIGSLPALRKRILTSATDLTELPPFLKMDDPARLDFLPAEGGADTALAIQTLKSPEKDKVETLFRLLCFLGNRSTIIFCNHRESVERTSTQLSEKGIYNEFYHGAMEQQERDAALCKFRNGTTNVLVTTDLAARGLDIPNIRYIIHFHLPHTEDLFTHRNGRTARMEASGTAILILSAEERKPAYITEETHEITLPETVTLPEKPKWTTLFVGAGKKDKVNKVDIVGFLSNRGELKPEDIGLIEVKDFFSFVAIRKVKASHTLQLIREHRLKGKKIKIEVAK